MKQIEYLSENVLSVVIRLYTKTYVSHIFRFSMKSENVVTDLKI